jgi:hypothetical protein
MTYVLSIVAVHGLNGDCSRTWTANNGRFCLRDFLLAELPFARIFTFGYDSKLVFSKAAASIADFALGLLDEVDNVRISPEVSCRLL